MPSDGVDGAQDGIPRDAVSKGFSLSEVLLISVGEGDISCPQLHVIQDLCSIVEARWVMATAYSFTEREVMMRHIPGHGSRPVATPRGSVYHPFGRQAKVMHYLHGKPQGATLVGSDKLNKNDHSGSSNGVRQRQLILKSKESKNCGLQ